jgi:hypothetical protein
MVLDILPLNKGLIFHIASGPRLANCPKESSMKKRGIPTNNCINQYGIRKAPMMLNKK